MKYLFYSTAAFFMFILTFALQNILFLRTNSLVYIYETFFAMTLYSSMCTLYFVVRFFEHKKNRHYDFLFLKTFSLVLLFSGFVICNLSFNFISIFSLALSCLIIFTSLTFILLSFNFSQDKIESTNLSSKADIFSDREIEVAELILQGKTAQQVADSLFVSLSTVKTHIQHIYEKAEVHNRTEFANWMQNHTNG